MKRIIIILMLILLGGALFAQHSAGNLMAGAEFGFGLNLIGEQDALIGNPTSIGLSYLGGLNFDYYIFSALSVSTGVAYRGTVNSVSYEISTRLSEEAFFHRGYLRIPVSVHANILFLWLGGGFAYNVILFENYEARERDFSSVIYRERITGYRSNNYSELFFDVGFDFSANNPNNSGSRLFARITPAMSTTSPRSEHINIFSRDVRSLDIALILQMSGTVGRFPIFK